MSAKVTEDFTREIIITTMRFYFSVSVRKVEVVIEFLDAWCEENKCLQSLFSFSHVHMKSVYIYSVCRKFRFDPFCSIQVIWLDNNMIYLYIRLLFCHLKVCSIVFTNTEKCYISRKKIYGRFSFSVVRKTVGFCANNRNVSAKFFFFMFSFLFFLVLK